MYTQFMGQDLSFISPGSLTGYLTTAQVAELRGVTTSAVRKWMIDEENPLPSFRPNGPTGRVVLILAKDAQAYKPRAIGIHRSKKDQANKKGESPAE